MQKNTPYCMYSQVTSKLMKFLRKILNTLCNLLVAQLFKRTREENNYTLDECHENYNTLYVFRSRAGLPRCREFSWCKNGVNIFINVFCVSNKKETQIVWCYSSLQMISVLVFRGGIGSLFLSCWVNKLKLNLRVFSSVHGTETMLDLFWIEWLCIIN